MSFKSLFYRKWKQALLTPIASLKGRFTIAAFDACGWGRRVGCGELEKSLIRAVVVSQLAERSLPIPEVRGSNPDNGKFL